MPAQTNVITTGTLADITAREIDFATQFNVDMSALNNLLGISRPIVKPNGVNLVVRRAVIDELAESVAEGEATNFTKVDYEQIPIDPIVIEKYKIGATLEAIADKGYDVAVADADTALRSKIRTKITKSFYATLEGGELEGTATGLVAKMALAKGKVETFYEQLGLGITGTVAWINTNDFYEYAGGKDITTQTAFGMKYIKDFLDYDVVFITSYITSGTVVATALNNLNVYRVDPSDSDFARAGLAYTADEDGLIGVHIEGDYDTNVGKTHAVCGVRMLPEYINGVSVITETP